MTTKLLSASFAITNELMRVVQAALISYKSGSTFPVRFISIVLSVSGSELVVEGMFKVLLAGRLFHGFDLLLCCRLQPVVMTTVY